MAELNSAGRVRPIFKGVWNASTDYGMLDVVTSTNKHAAYMALRTVPAGTPLNETSYWGKIIDAADGIIDNITQEASTADGGENKITVTMGDGTAKTFVVLNGKRGAQGPEGHQGPKGDTGATGSQGPKGDTGATGPQGPKGDTGATGSQGPQGKRGSSVFRITSGPSAYTTATGGFTPAYRVALSTVKNQGKTDDVVVGDTVIYSYYTYPVGYVDASYVYLGTRVSIRGSAGKTAYSYAQDGGYTGTEAEFAAILAGGVTGNKWAGKIASFLGDSITRGMNTDKTYHAYLAELVGFSACNSYGISGSTIANYYEPMCNRVGSIDTQSDIVFVFGGTNDFNVGIPMGEWYTLDGTTRTVNKDISTFRGALATLCEALLNRFPNKKNVLITPLHRHTYPEDYTELQANDEGLYLEDYVNAIKEAGKIYSIPVIDLYSESGLFPRSSASAAIYFHTNDKLHPNASGHRVIADVIRGFLDRTYPMYGEAVLPSYTNRVPSAEERIITGDALTAYDGVGYANNYRLSSSGVIKSAPMAVATGFIPVSGGNTIRIGGIQWCKTGSAYNYVCAYKSDYTFIGAVYGSEAGTYGTKIHESCTIDYDTPLTTIKLLNNADIAFVRISCYNETTQDGSKLIVTVNEEIN